MRNFSRKQKITSLVIAIIIVGLGIIFSILSIVKATNNKKATISSVTDFVQKTLKNPSEIWYHSVSEKSENYGKAITFTVNGNVVETSGKWIVTLEPSLNNINRFPINLLWIKQTDENVGDINKDLNKVGFTQTKPPSLTELRISDVKEYINELVNTKEKWYYKGNRQILIGIVIGIDGIPGNWPVTLVFVDGPNSTFDLKPPLKWKVKSDESPTEIDKAIKAAGYTNKS